MENVQENKLYSKVGKLIKIIDDLRDIGLNEVLSLPRICVLGTQSTGKSSVLESIIGLDCLPRGEGLVTRRPLELRLVHIPHSQNIKPWAEFEERKGKRFEDFELVRKTINELTEEVAQGQAVIINKPIRLTIHSNTCPDLTVIDLPGITKIPYKDQQKNIEEITKEMCKFYCKDPSTIILCTIAANADITTSDALNMAMDLDPSGDRTIGVLTKVDIMDSGTNVKAELMNEVVFLKRGYVAVKNRSQQDIKNSVTVQQALSKEKDWFRQHPLYRNMNYFDYFGTDTLIEKLKVMFFEHLTSSLPNIYLELKQLMKNCQEELEKFGTDYVLYSNDSSKYQYITTLLTVFCDDIEKLFSGKMTNINDNLTAHKLKLLYKDFLQNYKALISSNMKNDEIIKILRQTEGDRLSGFPEAEVVHSLLDGDIDNLRNEVKTFLDSCFEIVNSSIKEIANKSFCRFPVVLERIEELLTKFIEDVFEKVKHLAISVSDMNFEYLYLDEKALAYQDLIDKFIGANKAGAPVMKNKDDYYNGLAEYVKILVLYYYKIILRTVREYVPKTVGHYFITPFKKELRFFLLKETNNILSEPEAMEEDQEVAKKRNYYINLMKILKSSEKALLQDEDVKKVIRFEDIKKKEIALNEKKAKQQQEEATNTRNNVNLEQISTSSTASSVNNSNIQNSGQSNTPNKSSQNIPNINNQSNLRQPTNNTNNNNNQNQQQQVNSNNQMRQGTSSNMQSNTNVNTNSRTGVNMNNNLNTNSNAQQQQQRLNTNNNNQVNRQNEDSNNRTYLRDDNQGMGNKTREQEQKGVDVNFRYDPNSNSIKDFKVNADAESAMKFYQNNKQHLPSKEQMISGASKTANFVKDSGALDNDYQVVEKPKETKQNKDPLTSIFGIFKKKEPENNTQSTSGNLRKGI